VAEGVCNELNDGWARRGEAGFDALAHDRERFVLARVVGVVERLAELVCVFAGVGVG